MHTGSATPFGSPLAPADARLPATTRVGGVRLQVSNLARSVAYYREVVGLLVLDEAADTMSLGVPGSAEPLVTLLAVPGTRQASHRGAFGLFHFAMLLPDRAALGRFVAHLTAKRIAAGMSDHRVSEAIYLSDPDGLGIEVYADKPRELWRYDHDQLVMATDPLDVGDLVAAAAGDEWTGAPPGTTMGHLHLHVGDLGQAATFYRDGLGFDITVWNYPGALFFSAGGYHHHLGANVWAPGPAPAPDQPQLREWALVVPSASDADGVGRRLRATGAPAVAEGQDRLVTDPWGTRLRIRPER